MSAQYPEGWMRPSPVCLNCKLDDSYCVCERLIEIAKTSNIVHPGAWRFVNEGSLAAQCGDFYVEVWIKGQRAHVRAGHDHLDNGFTESAIEGPGCVDLVDCVISEYLALVAA